MTPNYICLNLFFLFLHSFRNDPDGDTSFHFVQTEAPGDQYTEETIMKQEANSADGHGADPIPAASSASAKNNQYAFLGKTKKTGVKKERMKLLMQIQKDKNDLLESFKELMGTGSFTQQTSTKERNHVDLFFESVSSSVKALSPKLIAESKMRVSQLICELELRALTENEAAHNGSGAVVQTAAGATVVVSQEGGAVSGAYIINQPVATVVQHVGNAHHHEEEGQHYETLS